MSCDFCGDTGFHLSPDVVEPIMIPCTKKGCKAGKNTNPKPPKKTTTMSGVKYEWCVVKWQGPASWNRVTKKTGDFFEHEREFNKLKASCPLGHVKSIHVCWLDDIGYWGDPDEEQVFEDLGFDPNVPKLSQNDATEVKMFRKFLENKAKYGIDRLLKKKFWRKYLGVEE